jgi:hypothetical protein
MSYSRVQIYNLALSNIGVTASIQAITQQDTKTIALNNYYSLALEQTLKDYDWNFASCYRSLALTSNANSINPAYQYEFSYPDDCICAREIVTGSKTSNIEFEVATNFLTMNRIINTNVKSGTLRYTRNVDKEAFFPPEFVMTLSWYLSFLICDGIGMSTKKENAMKIYTSLLNRAMTANACEGYEEKEREASWIEVRS